MSDWTTDGWKLIYEDWSPEKQPLREALCTLGNGYFATRGAAEEADAGGPHYPGTYLAGGYNRLETEISGRIVENEDLVNWPNWLCLRFRLEGGEWIDLADVDIQDFRQVLDLRDGILERTVRFKADSDNEFEWTSRRLVHMYQPHLAAIEWTLTAENCSGRIEVESALDGTVVNNGVARYRDLNHQHLEIVETTRIGEDGISLLARTNQSKIEMAQAARTRAFAGDAPVILERSTVHEEGRIAQRLTFDCQKQRPIRIEKVVALYTSRDHAISEPLIEARHAVQRAPSFAELLTSHRFSWAHLWTRCDIVLAERMRTEFILRLHIFHLLQTTSPNTIDRDVGVPARGWHGEAYRGHIFWDELFIFPYLNLRLPELTRSLLMYRFRRLPEARHMALEAGYRGAMFPWQSGSNGREETQVLHLNPKSGRWLPDHTHRQRHVNAAIAYNVWQYYQASGDADFIAYYGAEMLLEIARFWASIATFNPERERYEIHGVVGPDEFHTEYPDSDEPGLNNNAYTNVMAVWVLRCALQTLQLLDKEGRQEMIDLLQLTDEEFVRWNDIGRRMYVPFHGDGIISQFEGYEALEDFDWEGYRQKYGDIQRLDRILEAEGNDPNRYQVAKQADVLMLFFLLSDAELQELFTSLGYPFDREMIRRNINYYLQRTSHGSTLSRVVHSWVIARSDREGSWGLFQSALESDIADIQGGTTSEGIHLGALAGTVDLIQRGHTGIVMRDDVLWFDPVLPDGLTNITLQLRYRAHWLSVFVSHQKLKITCARGWSQPIRIGFRGQAYPIDQGDTLEFDL